VEIIYPRVAGIDVGKREIAVAVRVPGDTPGERRPQSRKFKTFYQVLRQMVAWLVEQGVTHVAMEATGVYWKPVFHALCEAERIEVLLVNARHVKNVPGRKTDVKDSAWLAQLLECGLLRGSFIPPKDIAAIGGAHPLPQKGDRVADPGAAATVQSPGGRWHQNRLGGLQHHHTLGAGHDRGTHRRGTRPARAGRARPRGDAHQDPGPGHGVCRAVR
jgi:hypothetical protein